MAKEGEERRSVAGPAEPPGPPGNTPASGDVAVAARNARALGDSQALPLGKASVSGSAPVLPKRRAVVIGASSGIGRELAKILARNGYTVAVTARRVELLRTLAAEIGEDCAFKAMDISRVPDARRQLEDLIREMGGVDLVVISAGCGDLNPDLEWDKDREVIDVNVSGFAAQANVAMRYFLERGSGHLVGISSIAALRGGRYAPAYNASKAFVSNYLQGLRQKAGHERLPIVVTDIQPGFVDTAMMKADQAIWVASAEDAARQIYAAIRAKRSHAYITRRWRLLAWLFRAVPGPLYNRH